MRRKQENSWERTLDVKEENQMRHKRQNQEPDDDNDGAWINLLFSHLVFCVSEEKETFFHHDVDPASSKKREINFLSPRVHFDSILALTVSLSSCLSDSNHIVIIISIFIIITTSSTNLINRLFSLDNFFPFFFFSLMTLWCSREIALPFHCWSCCLALIINNHDYLNLDF